MPRPRVKLSKGRKSKQSDGGRDVPKKSQSPFLWVLLAFVCLSMITVSFIPISNPPKKSNSKSLSIQLEDRLKLPEPHPQAPDTQDSTSSNNKKSLEEHNKLKPPPKKNNNNNNKKKQTKNDGKKKKKPGSVDLHFIHIPKCGGTSMTTILRQVACKMDPEKNVDCCTNPGFCDWHAFRRCSAIRGCTDHFPNR